MKGKIEFTVLFLLGFVLGLMLLVNDARAQQPATDNNAKPASAQSGVEGPYTINSSLEFGVRGIIIDGNADKYRSDLNYTPGFRLFDSSFLMKSKDNDAPALDTLLISSFGWGKDPNRYLRVNAEKNKAYRFDANYRRLDYFNNLYNSAVGQHTSNTEYRQGDFNLTILPQSQKLRVNLGYSLDRNSGPSVSTFRFNGDEYPAAVPVRMAADEYRAGVDTRLWVFDLSFMQGWRFFKEDNQYLVNTPNVGNNPTNTAIITDFYRNAPTRGSTPFTRLSLHTLIKNRFDFTGRYVYTSANTDYTFFQNGHGTDSSANKVNSDVITQSGNAKRPNAMGDLALTFFATDSIRVSETFRVNNFRINGNDLLLEILLRSKATAGGGTTVLPPVVTNTLSFRTIDYRRFFNTIEGDWDINRRLSIHAGYRYTDRHIEQSNNAIPVGGTAPTPEREMFDNSTNTFIFGFKVKPVKMWSVYMDLEHGTNDNVFTRVDNYDFTNVRVRSILRPNRTLAFNASLVTKDNSNPAIAENGRDFGVNIKSRIFTSSLDWSPNETFSLSGGYTRTNVTSDADIILFLNNVQTFGKSEYFMRDNFVFMSGYVRLFSRATLFAAYRLHNDPGESRTATPSLLIGSFPYEMQSPEAKLVFKVHKNVDWIAGYQYFGYEVPFPNTSTQFYHAHLPYTSLRISFGRE
jgi:hypothetical protein